MSETAQNPTPAAPTPAPPNGQQPNPEPAAAAPEATPPWGDPENFNAEKAWQLIENLRAEKKAPRLTEEQQAKIEEYDRLAEASKSDLERERDSRTKAEERAQALLSRTVKAEVKALASEGFADPEDAAAFLDLSKYADGDGDVDSASIKSDLADLLARKPHLGKLPATRVPAPNPAQGASGSGAPSTEDDSYPAHWLPQRQQQ